RVSGSVSVNKQPATLQTRIVPGDTVETAPNGEIIFAVAEEAFLLRGGSRMVIEQPPARSGLATAMRLVTGNVLSVFGKGTPTRIVTATSTIGIRGTGLYAEGSEERRVGERGRARGWGGSSTEE